MSATDVSFERDKEQVLFLYHTTNLSLIDPFKVVKGGVMVDGEAMTFLEPESFLCQDEGVIQEGDDLESPQREHAIVEDKMMFSLRGFLYFVFFLFYPVRRFFNCLEQRRPYGDVFILTIFSI